MRENGLTDPDTIAPDEFVRWVFPRLFSSRLPRYESIAEEFGYVIDAEDSSRVKSEQDFLDLVADAMKNSP